MDYSTRRLKELREEANYSQRAVAEKIGVSDTAYQNYEYGSRDIPGNVLAALADLYETTTDYVLGLVDYRNKRLIPSSADGLFVDVPLHGSIAAGTPIDMLPVDDTHPVPAAVMAEHPDAFLLRVSGSSMDRILPDGCYALVDPCDDVDVDGKPYAVAVNGDTATIKRVRRLDNGFELVPDSTDPTFRPTVYDYGEPGTETVTIIGRVVYHVIPFGWEY